MAENFTAKQREIVARKLGYDGPMQGFNNFINSSPALGMKYAAISDKFATRMAKGGVVAKAPRRKFAAGGAVTQAKPNLKEFMDAAGVDVQTASNILYGNIGANIDARDWGAIMSSSDPSAAATQATAAMYSDPSYRAANTAHIVAKGYEPAQAALTYDQMVDRVGATYTPTAEERAQVSEYFVNNNIPANTPFANRTTTGTTGTTTGTTGTTGTANHH
jgi:hypothetical protein